jgi:hypothetical protein
MSYVEGSRSDSAHREHKARLRAIRCWPGRRRRPSLGEGRTCGQPLKVSNGAPCTGDPTTVLTPDQLLDDVMLHWLPATATSSARLYWESLRLGERRQTDLAPIPVATGHSMFPRRSSASPAAGRRLATRTSCGGTNSSMAGTSQPSKSQPPSLTRCGRSSAWSAP